MVYKRHKLSESGLTAIIVAWVIMIVITLIVIGSLSTTRRGQRQTLDRQLSTQAFYAAESGVNDAVKALAVSGGYLGYAGATAGDTNNTGSGDKTHCGPDASGPLSGATINQVNGANTKYTCLLINQAVDHLDYKSVDLTNPITADIKTDAGNPVIGSLNIFWERTNGAPVWDTTVTNNWPNFPPLATWNNGGNPLTGILRVALTNLGGVSPYFRANLNNNTFTAFLYPRATEGWAPAVSCGETNSDGAAEFTDPHPLGCQGEVLKSNCNTTVNTVVLLQCHEYINLTGGTRHYFLRLSSIYTASHVQITARAGANNTGALIPIKGVQAVVDSTGKAQDVLRRIQVRVPFTPTPSTPPPPFAVQSVDGICKLLYSYPGTTTNSTSPPCIW